MPEALKSVYCISKDAHRHCPFSIYISSFFFFSLTRILFFYISCPLAFSHTFPVTLSLSLTNMIIYFLATKLSFSLTIPFRVIEFREKRLDHEEVVAEVIRTALQCTALCTSSLLFNCISTLPCYPITDNALLAFRFLFILFTPLFPTHPLRNACNYGPRCTYILRTCHKYNLLQY
jgi:hypothetical protein